MRESVKAVVLCVVCFLAGYVCVSMIDRDPSPKPVPVKHMPVEAKPIPLVEPLPLVPMVDWSNVA